MNYQQLAGMQVHINPLLEKGTVVRCLKDTPQEYVVVDSEETLKDLVARMNLVERSEHA